MLKSLQIFCATFFFFIHDSHSNIFFLTGKRQTVLFSATQTRNVEDLARVSLKKAPLYVGVDDHKDTSTVEGLEQVGQIIVTQVLQRVHYSHVVMVVIQ